MDNERLTNVKSVMHVRTLDALVCRLPENVLLLSGCWPMNGWSFLLFPAEGEPTIIVPHCEEAETAADLWQGRTVTFKFGVLGSPNPYEAVAEALKQAAAGKGWTRVGYEGSFESVAPPWNAAEPAIPASVTHSMLQSVFGAEALVDATDMLRQQRARKTSMEIDKLRIACEIAAFGLEEFFNLADVGVSGLEIVTAVERAVMLRGSGYKGAKRVRAFAQCSTGAAETSIGYRPMEITTHRKLGSGDLALLELAVVADGFWSDRTRVRVAGTTSQLQLDVYQAVLSAQEAAIKAIRPGIKTGVVDEAARSIIRDAGFEHGFPHVTGHGLGFGYHEPTPLLAPGGRDQIDTGMFHTVEPGVYLPEMGGIRIEDNVAMTQTGPEVLGPFAKGLH